MFSLWKRAYIAEKGAGVHAYNRCYYSVSDGSVRPFRSFKALPGSKRSFVQTNQQPRNTFSIIVSFRNEFEENDSGSFYGSVEHNSSYHDFAEICAAAARQENLDKSHCSRPPTVTLHHRSKTILQCTQMDLHKYVAFDRTPARFSPFSFPSSLVVFSIFHYIKWNWKLERDSRQRNRNVTTNGCGVEKILLFHDQRIIDLSRFTYPSFVLFKKKKKIERWIFLGNADNILALKTSGWRIDFLAPIYKPSSSNNNNNNNVRSFQRGVFKRKDSSRNAFPAFRPSWKVNQRSRSIKSITKARCWKDYIEYKRA